MVYQEFFQTVRKLFDGSWRDIYVSGTLIQRIVFFQSNQRRFEVVLIRLFLFLMMSSIFVGTFGTDVHAELMHLPDTKDNRKLIKQVVLGISRRAEYVSDMESFGKPDYGIDIRLNNWQGDCEDFALAYQSALRKIFPQYHKSFKVMLVNRYDQRAREDSLHAVLFIYTNKRIYVAEGPSYYPNGRKVVSSPIWLRASQYVNENRVYGEIDYVSPEHYVFVSQYTPYVPGQRYSRRRSSTE